MKFTRLVITLLILTLASGPTFASLCATTCASHTTEVNAANDQADMSGMSSGHCHESEPKSNQDQKHSGDMGCVMAGCHFAQTVLPGDLIKTVIADFTDVTPIYFNPLGISADLSPPLKPPA